MNLDKFYEKIAPYLPWGKLKKYLVKVLRDEAAKTETEIDDTVVNIIEAGLGVAFPDEK